MGAQDTSEAPTPPPSPPWSTTRSPVARSLNFAPGRGPTSSQARTPHPTLPHAIHSTHTASASASASACMSSRNVGPDVACSSSSSSFSIPGASHPRKPHSKACTSPPSPALSLHRAPHDMSAGWTQVDRPLGLSQDLLQASSQPSTLAAGMSDLTTQGCARPATPSPGMAAGSCVQAGLVAAGRARARARQSDPSMTPSPPSHTPGELAQGSTPPGRAARRSGGSGSGSGDGDGDGMGGAGDAVCQEAARRLEVRRMLKEDGCEAGRRSAAIEPPPHEPCEPLLLPLPLPLQSPLPPGEADAPAGTVGPGLEAPVTEKEQAAALEHVAAVAAAVSAAATAVATALAAAEAVSTASAATDPAAAPAATEGAAALAAAATVAAAAVAAVTAPPAAAAAAAGQSRGCASLVIGDEMPEQGEEGGVCREAGVKPAQREAGSSCCPKTEPEALTTGGSPPPGATASFPPGSDTGTAAAATPLPAARVQFPPRSLQLQVPGNLAMYLRPYQKEGVQFLHRQWARGVGGILADDMGLGKTVQTIAFIAAVLGKEGSYQDSNSCSFPDGWRNRAGSHIPSPHDQVLTLEGTPTHKAADLLAVAERGEFEVVLMGYETMTALATEVAAVPWHACFFDEAHRLKNHKTKVYKAAKSLKTPLKYGLSGTIMQNRHKELWCIVDCLRPGYLGDSRSFMIYYTKPLRLGQQKGAQQSAIDLKDARLAELIGRLKQVVLRRTKAIIADQMPSKINRVVFVELSWLQTLCYQRFLESPDVQLIARSAEDCDCNRGETRGKCCYTSATTEEGDVLWPLFHECDCENPYHPVDNPKGEFMWVSTLGFMQMSGWMGGWVGGWVGG
ncbi:MAG: hypothetical protein WDW38_009633 [Sanguina aurantia]